VPRPITSEMQPEGLGGEAQSACNTAIVTSSASVIRGAIPTAGRHRPHSGAAFNSRSSRTLAAPSISRTASTTVSRLELGSNANPGHPLRPNDYDKPVPPLGINHLDSTTAGRLCGSATVGTVGFSDVQHHGYSDIVLLAEVVVALMALAVLLSRPDGLRRTGALLIVAAATTLPWNGLQFVPGVGIGDLLLLFGMMVLGLGMVDAPLYAVPSPVLVGASAVALAATAAAILPPTEHYLSERFQLTAVVGTSLLQNGGNGINAAKFEVALLVLPFAVGLLSTYSTQWLSRIALAWLLGITISSIVAILDSFGTTHISLALVHNIAEGRQTGLTAHPNNVGVQAAMAMPLAMFAATNKGRTRWLGRLAVFALPGAAFVSESRGSIVALPLAAICTATVLEPIRTYLKYIVAATIASFALIQTPVAAKFLQQTRLGGSGAIAAQDSNTGRHALFQQGVSDLAHSPIYGIGFKYITNAHVIYVQLLAAGGLFAFVGWCYYVVKIAMDAHKGSGDLTLVRIMLFCTATWLLVGLVENQLTDRYLYVPLAVLVGLGQKYKPKSHVSTKVSAGKLKPNPGSARKLPTGWPH